MTKREESIVRLLLGYPDKWMTRREIAKRLGLSKTPYLIDILDSLVERGVIVRELGEWGGFSCYFFTAYAEDVQKFIMLPVAEWFAQEKLTYGGE